MPVLSSAGRAVGSTIKGARLTARGGSRFGRWIARNVGSIRVRGGGGEVGMMRLLDLHAASCAGDTLITMGLAGTVFFSVPVDQARTRVALYLLITMAPFALLAPIVGPLLDRFRHGRRYALAVSMLGRAFLAWVISDSLHDIALYPAAFGVLALSRAYGVARSAAVPRLLPPGLGLSEAGARASIFGTLAGAAVAPLGVAAFWIGPQWPLRVAAVVFVLGTIVALRLPAKADSAPPEVLPRVFKLPGRDSVKILSGRLIVAVLSGSAGLRAMYGFLTLFLAFSIRSHGLTTNLLGANLSQTKALAFAIGALGVGTFIATAIGSRMKIHRPALLQAGGITVVAVTAAAAALHYSLGLVIILCLATSIVSGLAKLAVDATIQEQTPEEVRASAFAHSETLLMLAWVAGGALGLLPFPGRVGLGIAAVGMAIAAIRAIALAVKLRGDRLRGTVYSEAGTVQLVPTSDAPTMAHPAASMPAVTATPATGGATAASPAATTVATHGPPPPAVPVSRRGSRWSRRRAASRVGGGSTPAPTKAMPTAHASPEPATVAATSDADRPSYHLYRPTSSDHPTATATDTPGDGAQ